MFEKYTQSARITIFGGRYQASLFGSPFIEVEHLLLGLLTADEALCIRVFKSPAKLQEVRTTLESETPRHEEEVTTSRDLPLSDSSKRVLSHAAEIANQLNQDYIAPEHLLFGIARENESAAARILFANGITLGELEEQARHSKAMTAAAAASAGSGTGETRVAKAVFTAAETLPDLVAEARDGELAPLIGRGREVEQMLQILARRTKHNVVLIGDPGIGKEAVVYGIAQLIADDNVPAGLVKQWIVRVDAPDLARALGPTRSAPQAVLRAVYDSTAILYVRGLFDRREAIPELGAFLRTGRHSVITTGTALLWQLAVDRNDEVARAFEPVHVSAPTEEETVQIINAHKAQFEAFHGIVISDEAIEAAVAASARFMRHRALPDRVLDLIDEAGAAVRVRRETPRFRAAEAQRTSNILTGADVLNGIAARTSLPLEAVRSAMALPPKLELLDQLRKDIASCVPPGRRDWIEGLLSYLNDSPSSDADRLLDALRSAAVKLNGAR